MPCVSVRVTKHNPGEQFIDCCGVVRSERVIQFNLLRFFLLMAFILVFLPARALDVSGITLQQVQPYFPSVTQISVVDKRSGARAVFAGGRLLGYLFLTHQITPIPAYSGKPIEVLVGLDLSAQIKAVRILYHEEPILVVGVTDADLEIYTDQYINQSAQSRIRVGAHNREGYIGVDGISGATITAMVLNRSIMRSAKIIAEHYGLPQAVQSVQPADIMVDTNRGEREQVDVGDLTVAENQIDWLSLWDNKGLELNILLVALLLLIIILFFQDWLVVRTRLFKRLRLIYLFFTVFYIGFYCMAQLSIMNVLAFIQLLINNFTWETLMIDPLIFTLWGFVAMSILLWGRGVYCGWLCPFGAIQELIHKGAEKLGLKSYEFPQMVHERLWAIKYIILMVLIGVSLESMGTAARIAEVEPFKTTISMRFQREWWFVAYALALLVISVFNSKFFCKYLCPLGASLGFATRFRIFDWLRRRKECGRPCQTCAAQCQISSIRSTGEIIDTECHYCLECQVTYWDEHKCPPLVEKYKRRQKRLKRAQKIPARTVN